MTFVLLKKYLTLNGIYYVNSSKKTKLFWCVTTVIASNFHKFEKKVQKLSKAPKLAEKENVYLSHSFCHIQRLKQKTAKMLSRMCQNSQKSENTQTSEVNSKFFSKIYSKHDTPLQSLGIHYSSALYSTLLSFFVLKIISRFK